MIKNKNITNKVLLVTNTRVKSYVNIDMTKEINVIFLVSTYVHSYNFCYVILYCR